MAIPDAASADLRSDREYTLFEMKWEWMAAAGSNSGVKYRLFAASTVTFGAARFAAGWEYQMADDAGDGGAKVDDRQKSGALYGVVAVGRRRSLPGSGMSRGWWWRRIMWSIG